MLRAGLILLFAVSRALSHDAHCPSGKPSNPLDVGKEGAEGGVFSDLTSEEINGVLEYMYERSGLGVTQWDDAKLTDTFLYVIEALPTPKADVLSYLDAKGAKPTRYAKVILYKGASDPPVIEELKVGPLPAPTSHEVLKNPSYSKHPIPYHYRNPFAVQEGVLMLDYLHEHMKKINGILSNATGGWTFSKESSECGEKCLIHFALVPGQWKSGSHQVFINFMKNFDTYYLHPIGLQVRLDHLSLDPANWTINFVWFRGTTYTDLDDFAAAAGPFTPIPDPENAHDESLYSSMNFRGEPEPIEPMRGPRSYYPDGRRYSVQGHHVEWQGWAFDFGVKTIQGLHVNDIRFKGERVVSELSVQELASFYSGDTPMFMHSLIFDSIVFLGREVFELQPGIDCPEHATFFDFVHFFLGKAFVFKNSVCLFEHDMGIPLRRHYETDHVGDYVYVQGMPDNALVLRSIVTAYNYEYINDVIFHQQGGIETKLSLSGYILASFYHRQDDSAGFEVFPNGQGTIHHHFANFKVDLDIKGTSNRFETFDVVAKKFDDPVDVGEQLYANRFVRNLRKGESDAQFTPEPNQYLIFYNDAHENVFGNKQGYRLQVLHPSSVIPGEDYRPRRGVAVFRNPVSVTVHNDSEFTSSLIYAASDAFDPILSFEDFHKDNQSIVDQDLVTWVTLGTVHIPHTEDIPVVTTQNVQLTFHLTPYNYFQEDPSLASRDNVRVERTADGGTETTYAGVASDVTCVPRHVKLAKKEPSAAVGLKAWCELMLAALGFLML